jgi:hypothetical protein
MEEEITINEVQPDGSILNDLTIGRYDVVITDTPTTTTFEQSQFMEMMEMLERGVQIPQHHVIRASSLVKKHEIIEEMSAPKEQEADPEMESKVADNEAAADLKRAQAEKVRADMVNSGVDAMYSAIQTAGVISTMPQTANLADRLLLSAGYEDKDDPPIVPELGYAVPQQPPQQPLQEQLPPNTNPTTPVPPPQPDSPAVGANAGIETQEID